SVRWQESDSRSITGTRFSSCSGSLSGRPLGGQLTMHRPDPYLKLLEPQAAPERFWRSLALFLPGLAGSTALFLTLDIPPAIRTTISGTDVAVRFRLWSF